MKAAPSSLVLLASAGTGKTYRLSLRYLQLLQDGVAPSAILASTFTRKAAGEILGAILCRLAEACAVDEKRQDLALELGLSAGWPAEEARALLRSLLEELPKLNIRTLDSWFQTQVGAAALELGLPLGWRLAEEVDLLEISEQAVEATVIGLPTEESLGLLEAMQSGKAKRSVLGAGQEILKDAARWWLASDGADAPWESLAAITKPSAQDEEEALDLVLGMPIPENKAGKKNKNWLKAQTNLQQVLEEQDWKKAATTGLLAKVFQQENTFYKMALPRESLVPAARICARHLLWELHRSNLALRTLAGRYATHEQEAMRKAGLINYDDFPASLAACAPAERHRIEARLGQESEHLLLDEFQDTNPLQWKALEPMATQAVKQEERSLLVVGDVKQSIYGFRQGEARLLAGMSSWLDIPAETLTRNYRSRQAILDAVNQSFGHLQDAFGADSSTIRGQAVVPWANFPAHVANDQRSGAVRVWQVYGQKKDDSAAMRQATLQRVLALYAQDIKASIAVLVRGNKVIPQLIAELAAKGVPASGAGGNPLTDSRAVDTALSLFQLADHPGDTASWFHVATSALAPLLQWTFREERADCLEDARRASRQLRRRLLREGYGPFLEKLYRELKTQQSFDSFNLRRFGQLVELGLQWDARATLRPAAFAQMVRERKVADGGSRGVQIMTVHQAKGLAFDVVVIPVESAPSRINPFFAMRPEARGPITAVSRMPSQVLQQAAALLSCADFQEALAWDQAREINDMLCVMYVAMTRARRHMELLLPALAKNSADRPEKLGADEFLRSTLLTKPSPVDLPEMPEVEPQERTMRIVWQDTALHEQELEPFSPSADAAGEPPSTSGLPLLKPLFRESSGQRALPRWSPSSTQADQVTGASLLQPGDDLAMRRGTALHALFACVTWLPTVPAPDALRQALAHMQPPASAEESAQWLEEFAEQRAKPAIAAALTKGEGEATLWIERPFAVSAKDPHGQEAILQGIYDRVVLWSEQGTVARAEILDFKTGTPPADGVVPEGYCQQLQAYRTALSLQLGLAPEKIRLSLLYLDGNCQLFVD